MSYHIIINKNQNITYGQLLKNSFVPNNVCIKGKVETDEVIVGYSKFYLENESARGVALTVGEAAYDVELNICASTADYILAAKLALAIAQINNSIISPEFDDELSLDQFEVQYNSAWAHLSRLNGVDTLRFLLEKSDEVMLPGCIRPFYFGNYVLNKLSQDQPDEGQFADRVIDEIRKIQFIDQATEDLEVPTLMDANFPEGVQTVQIILPEYKLLLQKSDLIILRMGSEILKIDRQRFIQHPSLVLERLDEVQYILQPIEKDTYLKIMRYFSSIDVQPEQVKRVEPAPLETEAPTKVIEGKWWQFWR
ncbi:MULTISPECIES: hypothetical protein [Mucilaginibacter]|jgi:hypothetical protein|uniref:hypothetical protein n=1 Tax=Mucilaginibacter TaxID=423349 RepID=UPI001668110C|nr:hypothetical protein [Mucilaginibacter rubeus]GGB21796.1 hypothetical protein GCM10011500_42300 [Mucilaginibacter rubeus]